MQALRNQIHMIRETGDSIEKKMKQNLAVTFIHLIYLIYLFI